MSFRFRVCLLGCLAAIAGCSSTKPGKPIATDVNPEQATADYWLKRPAVATVTSTDFDQLFNAASRAARARLFKIDQADRREGVILTQPTMSKQFFEIWRNDTGTASGTLNSSIWSARRTLSYQIVKNANGTFTLTPKVLIERYSTEGHRVTVPSQAPYAFDPPAEEQDPYYRHYPWPATYWYAVGRDEAMERQLAASIESHLKAG